MSQQEEVVFRKPYLSIFSLVVACVFLGGDIVVAVAGETSGRFIYFPVASIAVYCMWLLGWRSGLRVRADELIVDNLVIRHHISWGWFFGLVVEEGLGVRLRNRKVVGSVTFGGSAIGNLLGYKYTNRVRDRIEAALPGAAKSIDKEQVVLRDGYQRQVCLPIVPMIVIAIFFGVITIIPFFF